jgi:hypothetical protein
MIQEARSRWRFVVLDGVAGAVSYDVVRFHLLEPRHVRLAGLRRHHQIWMNPNGLEERPNCVIEDGILLRFVDVLIAQEIHEIARVHAVKAVEEHVESVLKMDKLALLHVGRVEGPLRQMIENLKEVGEEGADRRGDDRQQRYDAQQARHECRDIAFELQKLEISNTKVTKLRLLHLQKFQQLLQKAMIHDLVQPRRVLSNYLTEENECSLLVQLVVCLLQTLLELVEDVGVVWRLHFD